MLYPIEETFISDLHLSGNTLLVYAFLHHSGDGDYSNTTISEKVGASVNTVRKCLGDLEEKDLIHISGNGTNKASTITLKDTSSPPNTSTPEVKKKNPKAMLFKSRRDILD